MTMICVKAKDETCGNVGCFQHKPHTCEQSCADPYCFHFEQDTPCVPVGEEA